MSAQSTTARGTTAATDQLPARAERPTGARRVLKELAYIALGVPLSVLYIILLIGLLLGAMLGAGWIGLPLLLASSGLIWRCAGVERQLANQLLEAGISPLPPLPAGQGPWQRARRRLQNRAFWRAVALLSLRLPITVLSVGLIAAAVTSAITLLVIGMRALGGSETGYFGPFTLDPILGLLLCLLAVPVAVVAASFVGWAALGLRGLTRALLMRSLPAGAPVRESLAQSLGDRTLSIAYWLADEQTFVDERGRPVPLPPPGSERAWTAVDYEGRRVAAIIHDASLEASPELVQAAAAAASLALDNERLKAALRARVEELRASRVRIVEASNIARRRLERNLHDGAQQQLVAMAVELRLLRNRIEGNDEAAAVVDRLETKLGAAVEELRELARGVHPGILTDRGLGPALEALATRAPLPIKCEIEFAKRPPESVEAVAYFVIAEALTNVLKYAQASHATIRGRYDGDEIVVEMEDDGVGGADESKGTGLQGLRDRVGALDGTLTVVSEPGSGTRVHARIPCAAETLIAEAQGDGSRYG